MLSIEIPQQHSDRLAGKAAIVTGAGTEGDAIGVGRAIAILLARAGARVCVADIAEDRARATVALIEEDGGAGFAQRCDVSVAADCAAAVHETVSRYGGADILVNNAAIRDGRVQVHELEEAVWDRVMSVNVKGAMLMSKAVLPHFFSAGAGAIVNISSISGALASGATVYDASKAALSSLTRDLALDYGKRNIRVNAIAPGAIPGPMLADAFSAEQHAAVRKLTPLAREGSPWDIAAAAVFLASDDAAFVSGSTLTVDGAASSTLSLIGSRLLNE